MPHGSQNWNLLVGANIRRQRKALALSLEDLSRLSGATVPSLSHIERGKRDVKLSTLVAIAEALRVDLPTLFAVSTADREGTDPRPSIGGYTLDED